MSLILRFPFPPLSQNNAERTGIKTNHRYKTQEAITFKKSIAFSMNRYRSQIDAFLESFDPNNDAIEISYLWKIHHTKCLTKKGSRHLSIRGGDCGNYEKLATDYIFNVLRLNDFYIWKITQRKVPSMEPSSFHAEISRSGLDSIKEFESFF